MSELRRGVFPFIAQVCVETKNTILRKWCRNCSQTFLSISESILNLQEGVVPQVTADAQIRGCSSTSDSMFKLYFCLLCCCFSGAGDSSVLFLLLKNYAFNFMHQSIPNMHHPPWQFLLLPHPSLGHTQIKSFIYKNKQQTQTFTSKIG